MDPVLVVAATPMEIAPLQQALGGAAPLGPRLVRHAGGPLAVDVLTTGVGMVPTAAWCARVLAQGRYRAALNLGVCGSFDPSLPPGTVVHVVSDRLAELGAEDGDAFLPFAQLGLDGVDAVENPTPPSASALASLPRVRGITVNTAHGDERSIAAVVSRCQPQVESMEGAAFMFACQVAGVPFAQVRAVSNRVERRNRGAWKLAEAIENLGTVALQIVSGL